MPRNPEARCDLLKMAYATMLLEVPAADIVAFWEANRLTRSGRKYSAKETLTHIWDHRNRIPLRQLLVILANVDSFLNRISEPKRRRFDAQFLKISHAMPMLPGAFLEFAAPLLHLFFRFHDPRYALCSRIIEENQLFMMPGTFYRYYDRKKDRTGFSGYAILAFDPSFGPHYPTIDIWRWVVLFLANGCQSVGLPPIDSIMVRADMRPLQSVSGGRSVEVLHDGTVLVAGRSAGRRLSFRAFCRAHGFDLRDINPPEAEVLVVDVDKGGMLPGHTGLGTACAFGAPLYIIDFRCSRVAQAKIPENPMQRIIELGTVAASHSWPRLGKLHLAFVDALRDEYSVLYDVKQEVLSINGKVTARSVVASVIGGIIHRYCLEARTSFTRKDILEMPEVGGRISDNTYNVYVQRACRYLSKHAPNLRLIRDLGEGTVRFQALAGVRIEEASNHTPG